MKLIETYSSEDAGYNPFLIRGHWQVARLNYLPENGLESLKMMEVHYSTDEVFVVLKGAAVLIASEGMAHGFGFKTVRMLERVVYNIPKGVWHSIVMKEDAEVLIVEDANTHLGNYELSELSSEQQKELKMAIKSLIDEECGFA